MPEQKNEWKIGPVKLVNGEQGFIDAINQGQQDHRYTGRAPTPFGNLVPAGWSIDGTQSFACDDKGYNLAPPPKKTLRVRLWLNVYDKGRLVYQYGTRELADIEATSKRFACIEIDREVEEGEGLDPNVRSDAASMRSR
jgi:hypothetical protein